MSPIKSLFAAAHRPVGARPSSPAPAQAQNWPTRPVKFIVPFGPGAGADIGARLFAEKLTPEVGPAGGDREPARRRQHRRDQGVPVRQRRSRAAVRAVRQFHRASVHLQQAVLQSGRPDPDRARLHTRSSPPPSRRTRPTTTSRSSPRRRAPTPASSTTALVQGITEFTFWGYLHHEKLQITAGALSRHQRGAGRSRRGPHPGGDGVAMRSCSRRSRPAASSCSWSTTRRRIRLRRTCRPRASRAFRRSRWKDWSACSGSSPCRAS